AASPAGPCPGLGPEDAQASSAPSVFVRSNGPRVESAWQTPQDRASPHVDRGEFCVDARLAREAVRVAWTSESRLYQGLARRGPTTAAMWSAARVTAAGSGPKRLACSVPCDRPQRWRRWSTTAAAMAAAPW